MDVVLPHPEIANYGSTCDGQIYNIRKSRQVFGSVNQEGYRRFHWDGRKSRFWSVFVWECFSGRRVAPGHHIDHIDADIGNNHISNLREFTGAAHAQKSALTQRTCASTFTEPHYIGPEDWVTCSVVTVHKVEVSSLGRVRNKKGNVSLGRRQGGYRRVSVRNKPYSVHFLVCTAFHGEKPGPTYTVDHIDRNPLNNAAGNLRWATPQQQAANKDVCRPISAHRLEPEKGFFRSWNTVMEASRDINHDESSIRKALKGKLVTTRNMVWKRENGRVVAYCLHPVFYKTWPTMAEAERETGVAHSSIIGVCQGRFTHAGGFVWKYE